MTAAGHNQRPAAVVKEPPTHYDAVSQFVEAMAANGLVIKERIIADGKIHRYHVEGDRLGSKNAAVILHLDGNPAGFYQHFKTGTVCTWRADGKRQRLSHADRLQIELERQQRQAETDKRHTEAAIKAVNLWRNATPAINHPYLERKQIQAHQLRINRAGALLVPIYDRDKAMVNLQKINPDGEKRFLFGGKKRGCFSVIGSHATSNTILICEGWATGASLNEHTDHLTIVALDAGNLKPVAEVWRQLRPDAELIIMGDNDESGTGQESARLAALAVGGKYLVPPTAGHDWNDEINAKGGKA